MENETNEGIRDDGYKIFLIHFNIKEKNHN